MTKIALLLTAAALALGGTGCASSVHDSVRIVGPGPYPGVRTDVKLIGAMTHWPKNFRGSEKVAVAMCVPFGATLVAADVPLSLVADTCRLPADLRQVTQNQPPTTVTSR